MNNHKVFIGRILLKIPYIKRHLSWIYRFMGAKIAADARISGSSIIGDPSWLEMHAHSEINTGCFIVAKAKITIGENSTIAYQASLFTSAYPNGPWNELSKIYEKVREPITIGKNVWIGARSILLPGVSIGDNSVIAAGAVVTKDVPSGVMVAGCPAVVKRKIFNE